MAILKSALEIPKVEAALEDIGGGLPNLLPLTALVWNLQVEVPMWRESLPLPGLPEWLGLFWDGTEVDEAFWNGPVPPSDLIRHVPLHLLTEGRHQLHYEVRIFNGEYGVSPSIIVSIDRTPPYLGANEGKLQFADEVELNGVTARYLELNDDVLVATLPEYLVMAPGDRVVWYWDEVPFDDNLVSQRTLALEDIGKPLTIEFAGDIIRARGDGRRYAYYRVYDRAGNGSMRARPAVIETDVTPIPRLLPWPHVPKAEGTAQNVRLALEGIGAPLLVTLPAGAVIYPGEAVSVEWGVPGTFGYHLAEQPYQGQIGRYETPLAKVVAQAGKTVQVRYLVQAPEGRLSSQLLHIAVQKLPTTRLPRPYLEGAGVAGTQISLGRVGARTDVRLDPWFLMAAGQKVTVMVSGVSPQGAAVQETLLDSYPVRSGNEHVVTSLTKAFLQRLQVNSSFTITARLSFDGGESWSHQRTLSMVLIA